MSNRQIRSKKIFYSAFFILACLCLAAKFAYAYKIQDIDVEPRANAYEVYDDNVTYVKDEKIADCVTNIAPGINAKYEDENKSWELDTSVTEQLFANQSGFNRTTEDFNFNFKNKFAKFNTLTLKDIFSHTYEPVSFESAFGRTSGRYGYYLNRFTMGYSRELGERWSIFGEYNNGLDDFSREGSSDSSLNELNLGSNYEYSANTSFSLLYRFSDRDFSPGSTAQDNRFASGIKQNFTKQLYLEGNVGVDLINTFDHADYVKPEYSFSLVDDLNAITSARISFDKEFATTPYRDDIFNNWKISTDFTREPREKLGYSFSAFYGRGKYIASDVTDKLIGAEFSCFYNLTKKSKLELSYAFSRMDSTERGRSYNKNKVSLGLRAEF